MVYRSISWLIVTTKVKTKHVSYTLLAAGNEHKYESIYLLQTCSDSNPLNAPNYAFPLPLIFGIEY
jgi:hypothetical protein